MAILDLAIIGAGMAGLAAARRARELGLAFELLEASDRIGGRIRSIPLDDGQWWEAGCSHLLQPPINPLIKELEHLGIQYTKAWSPPPPLWLNGEQLDSRLTDETFHQVDEAESLIRELVETGEDSGISELLDPTSEVFELSNRLLAARLLADPMTVSARDRFTQGSFEGEWPLGVPFTTLLERMYPDIPVRLNAQIHVIDWSGEEVRINIGGELIECRSALVTVSTGVLSSGDIVFAPELDDDRRFALGQLPMNSSMSAILIPESPFDLDPDSEHVILDGLLGGITIRARPGGRNQLSCLVTSALDLEIDQIEQMLIAEIGNLFPNLKIDHIDWVNWKADPLVRGGWAIANPSSSNPRTTLAEPMGDRVWFAGEATSLRSAGTAHGAMQSGIDAVNRIAFHLGYRTTEPGVVDTDDIFAFDY